MCNLTVRSTECGRGHSRKEPARTRFEVAKFGVLDDTAARRHFGRDQLDSRLRTANEGS
jgi:hypothetical protein